MATSSERTPPPFPESEDIDSEPEIRDVESNENECVFASEDVTGAEMEATNTPDDLFFSTPLSVAVSKPEDGDKNPLFGPIESVVDTPDKSSADDFFDLTSDSFGKTMSEGEPETDNDATQEMEDSQAEADASDSPDDLLSGSPADTVSNPITDSIIKSEIDALDEPVEQPIAITPKEEPNKVPDDMLSSPLSAAMSKPDDSSENPLIDHSESGLFVTDMSSANDFIDLSSDSFDKPLGETDNDATDEVSQEIENNLKEAEMNNSPDDIFSAPTDNVSNPITDFTVKSEVDAANKPEEQPTDMGPNEEPNKSLDDIFSSPLSTAVSKPEDSGENPLIDHSESVMDTPDTSSPDDFIDLSSDSFGKPLGEWECETENDATNVVSREIENIPTEAESNDFPDDIFSGPTDTVSNPITDSITKSEIDAVDKPGDQSIDVGPNEEPNKSLDDIFSTPLSTAVNKPEDSGENSLIDHSESVMDTPDKSTADDFFDLSSESFDKPLDELECDDGTNAVSQEMENNLTEAEINNPPDDIFSQPTDNISNPITDSIIEPEVDAVNKPEEQPTDMGLNEEPNKSPDDIFSPPLSMAVSKPEDADKNPIESIMDTPESSDKPLGEGDLKGENDATKESQNVPDDLFGEPVSDLKDIPVADVLNEPGSDIYDPLGCLSSVVRGTESLSDVTEKPVHDSFSKLLSEPTSKQQKDLFGDPPDDLFSEMLSCKDKKQSSVFSATPVDICVEAKSTPITGPLTDDLNSHPSDTLMSSDANPDVGFDSHTGDDEEQDIFAEATVELSLDSPAVERKREEPSRLLPSASSIPASSSISQQQPKTLEKLEEEEAEDKFELNVSVTNPEKVGDGMNAYMAYRVSTQTTLPMFKSKAFVVRRRFSDFLGLYEKLSEKLSQNGYIVPPPPEKSIMGMTKVKVGKEDSSSVEFVEKRRAALERFLQRVVGHPSLLQDPDVRDFLEREELPRAVSTHTFSGAGFLKIISRATDAVSKMTIKMNESDVWFEEKLQEVEGEDQQLRKLHVMVDSLVNHRKDLAAHTAMFAKSIGMLGSSEDNTALSRALCQLAEVEDKIEQLHQEQAGNDFFIFAELLADYIRLLGAVRGCFDQRMKMWQRWQDAQNMLQKKREAEAKLLWANKPEKLQLAKEEITEWEAKVTQYERDFERISATVRKEVTRFEKEKAKDFKKQMLKYLQALLQSQQQLIKFWEAFLPEAKAIA